MNLRDLEYFAAVAEHRHFGKAAEASFATQPTLSMQLKKLETHLGVKLIERGGRRVLITPLGEKILARVRVILREVKAIEAIAEGAKDPLAGELKIGLFPTLAPYLLPRIVPGIVRRYPNLKLILVEEKTEVLIGRLKQGTIDAALLALPVKEGLLVSTPLFEEEFLLAVSRSRGWPKKKRIRASEIKGESLLLLEDGHCLRDQALEFCSRSGAGEVADFRASSLETLRQMVAAGVGMTLIPKMAMRKGDGILYTPFDKPPPSRRIGLVRRKSSVREKLMIRLGGDLREMMKGL